MALVYITLELTVPALLYSALFDTASLHSWLVGSVYLTGHGIEGSVVPPSRQVLILLVEVPVFVMTLLESQGLLSWLSR